MSSGGAAGTTPLSSISIRACTTSLTKTIRRLSLGPGWAHPTKSSETCLGDLSRAETRTAICRSPLRSHRPETTTLQRSTETDYLARHSRVTATTSYPQAVEKSARPPVLTGLEERRRRRETIWRNRRPSVSHRLIAIGGSAPASGSFDPSATASSVRPLGPTSMTTDAPQGAWIGIYISPKRTETGAITGTRRASMLFVSFVFKCAKTRQFFSCSPPAKWSSRARHNATRNRSRRDAF
jgi:hypothetical protein